MPAHEPRGPLCQSCGMPLEHTRDFGTDAAGYRANDFCQHCFAEGMFTEPRISMNTMLDRCVGIMSRQGMMPEAKARALMADVLPRLKRWRSPSGIA